MKAFVADHTSELGVVLGDAPDPSAGPGRVVVEVRAVSLNRGEVLQVAKYHSLAPGTVVGWDFAGVVVETATDGVGPDNGTEVYGWNDQRGTWADRVAVRVGQLATMPPGLDMHDASTLGVAALTAYAALGRTRLPLLGARVLVTGATGGVGTFSTQLALIGGAVTTAVVRPEADEDDVRMLVPDGAAVERGFDPDGPPADLIVESVGGESLSTAIRRVATGGVVVTIGRTTVAESSVPAGWFQKHAQLHGLSFSRDFALPGAPTAALERLGALVASGSLRTNITALVPKSQLTDVMRALLDRQVRGKVVVDWT